MALGDVVFFDQALVDIDKGIHQLGTHSIKYALITSAVTPSATTSDPRWGAGGGTNLSSSQVTPGGNYSSGGEEIANMAVSLDSGLSKIVGDQVSWAADASNPTNARWAIAYNDSDAGKRALWATDLGSAFDMTTGPLTINHPSGISLQDQA